MKLGRGIILIRDGPLMIWGGASGREFVLNFFSWPTGSWVFLFLANRRLSFFFPGQPAVEFFSRLLSWVVFFFRVVELSFFFPGRVAIEFFFPLLPEPPPPKSLMVLPKAFSGSVVSVHVWLHAFFQFSGQLLWKESYIIWHYINKMKQMDNRQNKIQNPIINYGPYSVIWHVWGSGGKVGGAQKQAISFRTHCLFFN